MKEYLSTYYHEVYENTEYYIHYFISVIKKPREIYRFLCRKNKKQIE